MICCYVLCVSQEDEDDSDKESEGKLYHVFVLF